MGHSVTVIAASEAGLPGHQPLVYCGAQADTCK